MANPTDRKNEQNDPKKSQVKGPQHEDQHRPGRQQDQQQPGHKDQDRHQRAPGQQRQPQQR